MSRVEKTDGKDNVKSDADEFWEDIGVDLYTVEGWWTGRSRSLNNSLVEPHT